MVSWLLRDQYDIKIAHTSPKDMAQLLIRRLEDDVKERLRRRALRHGQSMEAEVRDILRDALKPEGPAIGSGSRIAARFKHVGLREGEELPPLRGYEIKSPFEE